MWTLLEKGARRFQNSIGICLRIFKRQKLKSVDESFEWRKVEFLKVFMENIFVLNWIFDRSFELEMSEDNQAIVEGKKLYWSGDDKHVLKKIVDKKCR